MEGVWVKGKLAFEVSNARSGSVAQIALCSTSAYFHDRANWASIFLPMTLKAFGNFSLGLPQPWARIRQRLQRYGKRRTRIAFAFRVRLHHFHRFNQNPTERLADVSSHASVHLHSDSHFLIRKVHHVRHVSGGSVNAYPQITQIPVLQQSGSEEN